MSDDELMLKVGQGSSKAFKSLFERYKNLVFGYCLRLVQNKALSEDIAQEVWLKVVRSAPSYKGSGQFKAWLLTVARNTSFNELRKIKYEDEFEENMAGELHLESWFESRSDFKIVQKWIDELSEAQRVTLLLWATEGLSYEELAKELKTTVSSIKSLLFRARKALEEKRLSYEKKMA